MSEHDNAIDTVLKALSAVEPSAGFEQRMHQALHYAPIPKRTWRVPLTLLATAAALLCAVALGVVVRARQHAHTVVSVQPRFKFSVSEVVETQAKQASRSTVKGHTPKLVRVAQPAHPDTDEAVMTHQNIPPPPLPLTQEEKLVIRMLRHNDQPQLAVLSSEARSRSLHDDAEAYRTFFAPRPPLDGQPYYDQHISGGQQ